MISIVGVQGAVAACAAGGAAAGGGAGATEGVAGGVGGTGAAVIATGGSGTAAGAVGAAETAVAMSGTSWTACRIVAVGTAGIGEGGATNGALGTAVTVGTITLPGVAIRDRIFGTGFDSPRLNLRFSNRSDPQKNAAALTKALDFENRAELQSVETDQSSVRVVVDGRETTGSAAAATVAGTLGWLRPFRWVLVVPGLGGLIGRWLSGETASRSVTPGKPHVPAAS